MALEREWIREDINWNYKSGKRRWIGSGGKGVIAGAGVTELVRKWGLNGSPEERRWSDGLARDLERGENEFGVVEFVLRGRRDEMMLGCLDDELRSRGKKGH